MFDDPLEPSAPLSPQQVRSYFDDGFLILRKLISEDIIDGVNAEVADLTNGGGGRYPTVTVDVIHPPRIGRRMLSEVPLEDFKGPVKINDLFLVSDVVRRCNQNATLLAALRQLLGDDPLICNSLNFLYGSQQPPHFDTWYMPPPVQDAMAVSSICLEDMTADNGPLIYYPESHKMPPYRFAHGGIHAVDDEMPACEAYVAKQVEMNNLEERRFLGKKGDVFIWHSQLYHGGAPINDSGKTRKSLVTHYWRKHDFDQALVLDSGRGFSLKRD